MQRVLGGGKRDVNDRHVERDHQLGEADEDQDHPALGLKLFGQVVCSCSVN
jgi:hypothetical protein